MATKDTKQRFVDRASSSNFQQNGSKPNDNKQKSKQDKVAADIFYMFDEWLGTIDDRMPGNEFVKLLRTNSVSEALSIAFSKCTNLKYDYRNNTASSNG
jgi:hypothetical protein